MSKIFTFESIFEIRRIGRLVPDACKDFQIFEFSSVFFDFLIDSQPFPFFRLVILLDIYRAYKISTTSDARHDEAYFKNRKN